MPPLPRRPSLIARRCTALLTIDKLKTEIAYLKRMRYGRSSERLEHDTQMLLMDEAHAP